MVATDLVERLTALESQVTQLTAVLDEILAKNLPLHDLLSPTRADHAVLTSPVIIQFDEHSVIRNAYPADRYNGQTFKWLGPHASTTFPLPVERSIDLKVAILVPFINISEEILYGLSIFVDGEKTPAIVSKVKDGYQISFTAKAIAGIVLFPLFLVTLTFSQSFVLSAAHDPRFTTIAISTVRIEPSA